MKFIIAPAKKMVVAQDDFPVQSQPQFRDQAAWLLRHMQQLTRAEAQTLWHTSEKLTGAAYAQLQTSDVTAHQSPAIFSYVGIQYQYMAPDLLDDAGLAYIQQHLRILSGLYGILRPFDGIVPYRLEMQTRLAAVPNHSLYDFGAIGCIRHWRPSPARSSTSPLMNMPKPFAHTCSRLISLSTSALPMTSTANSKPVRLMPKWRAEKWYGMPPHIGLQQWRN